ncbi:MAG: arginyltransferase [Gammaproteobacteria bacterium]
MNQENPLHQVFQRFQFFISPDHPCSYLDNKEARTVFIDPAASVTMNDYGILMEAGFRRSGENIYRPACSHCKLCIPLRIPVKDFKPNRSQRRTIKTNQHLSLEIVDSRFFDEHYLLYRKYIQYRHPGGGMDEDDPDAYLRVISASWSKTKLLEFRDNRKLVAVAVIDVTQNALSAVYTYFDPDYQSLSPGVFAILSMIELAKSDNKNWLYLGYWNPSCTKMSYKNQYQPHEIYQNMTWLNPDHLDKY